MRTSTGYDDQDAVTRKQIYTEAKDFLQEVIDHESGNRSRAIDALKFRNGDQWETTLLQSRPDRLNITVNHTDTMVTRIENNLKQQRPRIKCHPLSDANVDKAKLVNGLVRDIENKSQASVAYDAGGSMALSIGWGYWRIVADYVSEHSFEQELKIKPIRNPFTVYKDPASVLPDGSDSMRYVISEKMKRIKYKQLYPKMPNTEYQDKGIGDEDMQWESKDEIRLAEYYRIIEKPERLFKMESGKTLFESDFEPGHLKIALKDPEKYGFARELDGSVVQRQSTRRQLQWFRLNGREVVDQRDLPGKYIPIIFCQGNVLDINGRVTRKGMIENMIEPAKLVNYWESSKAERLALTSKAPWKAYEGVTDGHPEWNDANQKNYSVLVGKAIVGPNGQLLPLPERIEAVSVEAGFAEASQDAEHQLMAIAGMPHEPGQDSAGEVVSGKAIQQRRALADDSHYQYYDNQTLSIAFTGRLLFDLIPYYYTNEQEQRIIGEDGVPQMVWINQKVQDESGEWIVKNDMTVGEYDVVMDTGPGYDTKRLEGSEALTAMLGTPMGEVITHAAPDIVMRSYDFPYADEIADRLLPQSPEGMKKAMESLPKQAQSIVQALQGQLQQAQQKMQQMAADLKYGLTKTLHQDATKLQIAHLDDQRSEEDTHMETSTTVFDTHFKGDTAIKVAEIKAGAQLLNTHVEAEHNRKAAEELLKHADEAESKPN